MAMFLEVDEIAPYLPRLMKPLVREITDASKTSGKLQIKFDLVIYRNVFSNV